jgi:hypothetical protein
MSQNGEYERAAIGSRTASAHKKSKKHEKPTVSQAQTGEKHEPAKAENPDFSSI